MFHPFLGPQPTDRPAKYTDSFLHNSGAVKGTETYRADDVGWGHFALTAYTRLTAMARSRRNYFRRLFFGLKLYTMVAVIAAATVLGIFKLPAPIADQLIEDDMRAQSQLWHKQLILQMYDAERSFETAAVTLQDRKLLTMMAQASEAYRFHLFDADGRVFWSTSPGSIGYTEENTDIRARLAMGDTYYRTDLKTRADIIASQRTHAIGNNTAQFLFGSGGEELRHVAEIYVPFMRSGQIAGAIEFYSDITDRRNKFITRIQLSLGAIAGAILVTMLIAVGIIHRTNRRHMIQVSRSNTKERDIIDKQLRLAKEVQLLGELNEWLQSSHSLDELFDMVARFMTHLLPNAEGSVYVYSNSRDVLDGCASWNGGTVKPHIRADECWGLRRGRTYEYGASEVEFTCDHAEPHDGRPYYCFPILAHGETVGLMHLRSHEGGQHAFRTNKKLARMCAEQISMAIANVRMRDQLQDQTVRDPLTGLFNRRHMTETLRKAITNSQSTGVALSLLAVDVDHFKKFNDNHGHDAGDMILRAVGSALEQACDGDQVACRMGGEEFTLILPDLPEEEVLEKAERLRQSIEQISLRYGEKTLPTVTISLGVSHYPQHGTMPQELMRAADEALYDAKAKGRNQVCIAAVNTPAPRDPKAQNADNDSQLSRTADLPPAIAAWDADRMAELADPDDLEAEDTHSCCGTGDDCAHDPTHNHDPAQNPNHDHPQSATGSAEDPKDDQDPSNETPNRAAG